MIYFLWLRDTSKPLCEIAVRIIAANLEDQLIDKVRVLPPGKALRLLDSLTMDARSEGAIADRKSIWEVVDKSMLDLPADTWENVTTDGSIKVDHYLYGAPRSSPRKRRSSTLYFVALFNPRDQWHERAVAAAHNAVAEEALICLED